MLDQASTSYSHEHWLQLCYNILLDVGIFMQDDAQEDKDIAKDAEQTSSDAGQPTVSQH